MQRIYQNEPRTGYLRHDALRGKQASRDNASTYLFLVTITIPAKNMPIEPNASIKQQVLQIPQSLKAITSAKTLLLTNRLCFPRLWKVQSGLPRRISWVIESVRAARHACVPCGNVMRSIRARGKP